MEDRSTFDFPPADLLDSLVSSYFDWFNIYTPLLHRPSFERNIREKTHLHDPGFGAVLLMVCALGSRVSDDPRVLLAAEREEATKWASDRRDGGKEQDEGTYHSAGWEWFKQVQSSRLAMSFVPARLYDLQIAYVRIYSDYGLSCS